MLQKFEKVQALVLYIILIAVMHAPVVFSNKTLQPAMYQPHGVVEDWPYGYTGRAPVNLFNIDMATPAYFEWPVNRLVGEMYRNGEVPLWNPYQGAGTPLAAQYSTRAFFPYQVLEDISPVKYWDFFLLGRLLIAGYFTYLLVSLIGVPFLGSFLAGALYIFSGSFTWYINLEQYANNAMMLPVFIYSLERLFRYRRGREAAFAGISTGLVLLAGQPEVALYVLFLGGLYFAFRVLTHPRKRRLVKDLRNYVVASALGLMLAAPLIIPFAEFMKNSHNIHPPGGDMGVQTMSKMTMTASFLVPNTHEFPQDPSFMPSSPLGHEKTPAGDDFHFRFFPTNGVWDFLGGYSGVVALFIALAGLFASLLRKRVPLRWPLVFFGAFGAVVVLKNFGVYPFVWLGKLPLFDQVWSQRWAGPTWTFSFAVAAGIGCGILADVVKGLRSKAAADEGEPRGSISVLYIPLAAAFLAVGALYLYLLPHKVIVLFFRNLEFGPFFTNFGPSLITGSALAFIFLAGALAVTLWYARTGRGLPALAALAAVELWWAMPRGYTYEYLFLKGIPLAIGLYAAYLFLRSKWMTAWAGVFVFFISFMVLDYYSPRGLPERYDPFTEPPFVELLRKNAGDARVIAGGGILFPNYSGALGLRDVRYINSLAVDSFQDFRNTYLHSFRPIEGESSSLWFTGRPELFVDLGMGGKLISRGIEKDIIAMLPYYSLLGVKYIVLPRGTDMNGTALLRSRFDGLPPATFPLVYDREVRIYQNTSALPRAYMTFDVETAEGYEDAQSKVPTELSAIGRTSVIERNPPHWFETHIDGVREGSVKIASETANRVVLEAEAGAPGLVVLSDVYYPGWRAYIDGKKADLLRVNGLVRGVFIEAGRHTVEFRYLPLSFIIGAVLCAVSLGLSGYLTYLDVTGKEAREPEDEGSSGPAYGEA